MTFAEIYAQVVAGEYIDIGAKLPGTGPIRFDGTEFRDSRGKEVHVPFRLVMRDDWEITAPSEDTRVGRGTVKRALEDALEEMGNTPEGKELISKVRKKLGIKGIV